MQWYLTLCHVRKIIWPFDGNDIPNDCFVCTVDGVHCRISEPRGTPSKTWFSFKLKKAGLAYELAIGVFKGNLIWINGPFPAGETDLQIYRKPGGLKSKIPPGKRVIGDRIYSRSKEPTISGRNPLDIKEVAELKERAKARHETFNSRIKTFEILATRFRSTKNHLQKHKQVFEACCVLVQYDIDTGSPLFEV